MELFIEGRRRVYFLFDSVHFNCHFTETSSICGLVKREGGLRGPILLPNCVQIIQTSAYISIS
jgi:hypothetical protein